MKSLSRPTPASEVKQRKAPGGSGKMLSYIDARYVFDTLDSGVSPENWQTRFERDSKGALRCGIGVLIDRAPEPAEWVWKWDVGDESDIEADKGAHSGAFKRAGVKWGIARDLYGKPNTPPARPSSPRAVAPSPRPVPPSPAGGDGPKEPDYLEDAFDARTPAQAQAHTDGAFCPDHGLAWVLRPGGTSKTTGKPYDPFWACPSTDRPFCKQKPAQKWIALQEAR